MLNLGAGYARRVEPRGTLGDIFATGDRIRYDLATANGTATVLLANASLSGGATLSRFGYLPVRIGNARLSQDYRDRRQVTGTIRADYRVGPGLRLFVSGTYNDQDYSQRVNGVDQNSRGYAVLGGASFGLTELISGEIGVGYLDQSYAEPGFGNIGGVAYNGRLTWNPTPLMTLTLNGARTIQQSPFVDQAGILQDDADASLDYELLRNLILTAQGSLLVNRYRGTDRKDRLRVAELRARYLLSRSLEAGLVLNHRQQSASGLFGRRYSGSSVSFSLTLRR